MATTHEQGLAAIDARFGAHAGHRALHAKGVICGGSFTAGPEAATLTRAAHMAGEPVAVTARISNGSGNPTEPDYAPDVRGLSVSFHLPDGSRTDILAQTLSRFPFHDQEGFFALMAISKPSPSVLLKLPGFAIRHPRALAALPETNRILNSRADFAARRYHAVHAFKWLDADGGERYVRYTWLPTVTETPISTAEAKRRGRDYLFEQLEQGLEREPLRMQLQLQVAGSGDDVDDPSSIWPDQRRRVIVGMLEINGVDRDADDGIVFDPMRLVDGIEPSRDPVLLYRPPVYSLSHARRRSP